MVDQFLAHVRQERDGTWIKHELESHLRDVSTLAAAMAENFQSRDWAAVAGLWHDLGKYSASFQQYIKTASGYEAQAHIEQGKGRVDHSTAGALYAMDTDKTSGQLLAYLIAGHHAGLPDWHTAEAGGSALSVRLKKGKEKNYLNEALAAAIPEDILNPAFHFTKPLGGSEGLHVWLRMLFSCLVDADFLDTERFMDPERSAEREAHWNLSDLKSQFDAYMAEKARASEATSVNQCRASVLRDCRCAGLSDPGIFTLTVPTGGGKTLSGMAFALEHAVRHNKQRIIVAIPYTSIIEQTAEQYRAIFGDAVLEHHANLDPEQLEQEDARTRLAAENWDAPIIVTTNVQLLESLFAARTSRCRKLHNVVNSVIILDEAQLLPPDFLQPILDVLRLLTSSYGVTLVLSSATQPALETMKDSFGRVKLRGLDAKQEIISDVEALFRTLSRVDVQMPQDLQQRISWDELAQALVAHPSVLAIVNTRKDARDLFRLMPAGTIHLSAQLCGEHRSRIIADIKQRLQRGESIRVISTQLVEAGVDLDFPVVYRALAGMDSIFQAAGRCNREGKLTQDGKLKKGSVVVFVPPKASPRGLLLYGEQATRSVLRERGNVTLSQSHTWFDAYFKQYFSQENPDKHDILPLLVKDARQCRVQFRSAAKRFRLIEDTGRSIIVPYGEDGFKWIDLLRCMGAERFLLRRVQRYVVNVYEHEFNKLLEIGAIEALQPGVWGLVITNGYDDLLGLCLAEDLYGGKPEASVF